MSLLTEGALSVGPWHAEGLTSAQPSDRGDDSSRPHKMSEQGTGAPRTGHLYPGAIGTMPTTFVELRSSAEPCRSEDFRLAAPRHWSAVG
jgi:hypothetical protein